MNYECTNKEIELIKAYRQLTSDAKCVIETSIDSYSKQKGKMRSNILSLVNENINKSDGEKELRDNVGYHEQLDSSRSGKFEIETEFNEQFYIAESSSGLLFYVMCEGDVAHINQSVLFSTLYATQAAVKKMDVAFEELLNLYGDALKAAS